MLLRLDCQQPCLHNANYEREMDFAPISNAEVESKPDKVRYLRELIAAPMLSGMSHNLNFSFVPRGKATFHL